MFFGWGGWCCGEGGVVGGGVVEGGVVEGGVVVGGVVGGGSVRVSKKERGIVGCGVVGVWCGGEGGVVEGWCCGRGRLWPIHFGQSIFGLWPVLAASGPPGLHTTTRELQTCTFERPSASNTTKIPREDPQRGKKE